MKFKFSEENNRWWDSFGDDSILSAGSAFAYQADDSPNKHGSETRIAFGNLVYLLRGQAELSIEQFAEEEDIDVAEILSIESNPSHIPDPRTVHQIASRFKLPEDRLMELAGVTEIRSHSGPDLEMKFAARSECTAHLTQDQIKVLEEYVRILCKR